MAGGRGPSIFAALAYLPLGKNVLNFPGLLHYVPAFNVSSFIKNERVT